MSSTIPVTSSTVAGRGNRRQRALAVLFAVLAPVVIWVIAVPLAGVKLSVSQGTGKPSLEVGLVSVVVVALVAALAGWGLLALLEKFSSRGTTIWTVVAVAVLVLSLGGPLTANTSGSAKAVLALFHLSVGAVLITLLSRRNRPEAIQ